MQTFLRIKKIILFIVGSLLVGYVFGLFEMIFGDWC